MLEAKEAEVRCQELKAQSYGAESGEPHARVGGMRAVISGDSPGDSKTCLEAPRS